MLLFPTQAGRLAALGGGLLAGLLATTPVHAAIQTVSGQFLDLSFDTAQLPSAFSHVTLVETPFEWDCSSASCTMVAPASVSVVFGSATGSPVAITQSSFDFQFRTEVKNAVSVVDPLGNTWGIAVADKGKWAFGANIAEQVAPTDAAFATAFGQFKGYVAALPADNSFFFPSWNNGAEETAFVNGWSPRLAFTEDATILGLSQTGWVGFGPGAQGDSMPEVPGDDSNTAWLLRADLISAYHALPSTTNPRCQTLSCMNFAEGILNVDNYAFKMAVVATPSPVPEAQTSAMALTGLGLLGWAVRRRRRSMQA